MVGFRYLAASSPGIAAQPRDIVNADQIVFEQPLTDIAARLGATPVTVSLSDSRIMGRRESDAVSCTRNQASPDCQAGVGTTACVFRLRT
jgi:hypothetical protein